MFLPLLVTVAVTGVALLVSWLAICKTYARGFLFHLFLMVGVVLMFMFLLLWLLPLTGYVTVLPSWSLKAAACATGIWLVIFLISHLVGCWIRRSPFAKKKMPMK